MINHEFDYIAITKPKLVIMYCLECDKALEKPVFYYSTENFGIPLCRIHQSWVLHLDYKTTDDALSLYFALKERGVPDQLEKHDGFKSVDIAIEEAKVHIEVDGVHHNFDSRQAMSDLQRTYHSFKKGYFTLRIPNSLVRRDLEETADWIVEILKFGKKKAAKKSVSFFKSLR